MSSMKSEWLREAVTDQAVAWFSRHRSGEPLGSAERDEFLAWLRASPLHVHGYLEVVKVAKLIPEALAGLEIGLPPSEVSPGNVVPFPSSLARPSTTVDSPLADIHPASQRRRPFIFAAATVVLAGLITLLTGDARWPWIEPRVISAPALKVRFVSLGDGSTVYLQGGGAIVVHYSRLSRSIDLVRGQALFDVVHDPSRPFRVRSGTAEVMDVGTRFDVNRQTARTTVTVLEGRVDVLTQGTVSATSEEPTEPGITTLRLTAGEQVQIGPTTIAPQVKTADLRRVTAWMHRDIRFDNRPLKEVIEQINRYALVPVQIEDDSLQRLRVNGVLDAYDSASLLLFLQQYGQIERTGQAIIVRSVPAAPLSSPWRQFPLGCG